MKRASIFWLSMGIILFSGCASKDKKAEAALSMEHPINVTVATPSDDNNESINISGQVTAAQTVNISTRVMGYITNLKVKVGDYVSKGQVIAQISNSDIIAKRAQTEAAMAETDAALISAKKDFDRFTALYKQQSASAKELDNATLQYNAVKAKVEAAKQMRNEVNAQLEYTTLTAPFAGVVTQKFSEVGSISNPGMPIVAIEQSDSYEISATVPESQIKAVKHDAPVTVRIKSTNIEFNGKVTQINSSSQFSGGQYIIKISIPEKDKHKLLAGMYAEVSIPTIKSTNSVEVNKVLVPVFSIFKKNDLTGIYTISANNTALLRWVRLGKTFGDNVEVLSGLEKKEHFIINANSVLYDGASVTINK